MNEETVGRGLRGGALKVVARGFPVIGAIGAMPLPAILAITLPVSARLVLIVGRANREGWAWN